MFNPRERSWPITFFAFLSFACLLLCGIASAAPSIILSKKSGPPTSLILVSGRGFKRKVGVDIYFGTKDEALVVTDGKGEFKKAKVYAPREARPGQHWVTALERNNDKGAQEPFVVQTDWSQFHFDADGTRLNPFENVLNINNVWSLSLKWRSTGGDPAGPSPTLANGVVYVGSDKYKLYALSARTGKQLWNFATQSDVDSSPAVADGAVYFGSVDYSVYAVNASTGKKLWSYPTGDYVVSSPVVANGVVYVSSLDDNLYALNASTGQKLWSYTTGSHLFSSPALANGVVYVGSDDHNVYALNASTGQRLWRYTTGSNVFSSPAVANGVVYVGSNDNNVYALNARTGLLLWSYATLSSVSSSPTVANGVVYVSSDDGKLYAFGPTPGGSEQITVPKRPYLKTLRPDFSLKVSKPVGPASGTNLRLTG